MVFKELQSQNENEIEIPIERYIFPEKRKRIIDQLRLVLQYNHRMSNNNKFVRQYIKSTD